MAMSRSAFPDGCGWSELHSHSAYSFMDGASLPAALAARAAALGYRALALTDHDNLCGLVAHARACHDVGITPIAGAEVTLADGGHLTLLARDAQGYRSLASLLSHAHLAGEKGAPRLSLDELAPYAVGLECLTGCHRGLVAGALLTGDAEAAAAALDRLRAIFGAAHTWVELQRGGLPDDTRLCYELARLARRANLPLVATGNSHYACAEDRDLQDVLVCLRHRLPLTAARPHLRPGAPWCLPAPAEMARRFHEYPGALRSAIELTERCQFDLSHIDTSFPAFPTPPGHTAASYLRELVQDGAHERYSTPLPALVQQRLEHELAVIGTLSLADYVLVVWDIVRHAHAQGILCQGRGSSVGSAVCYCLSITAVEPIAHKLSFERFLSIGRTDPPDIDLDLPADRAGHSPAREAVIQYVLQRYAGHAALVANVVTYQQRLAVREVGMALGLAPDQIAVLARDADLVVQADAHGIMCADADGADGAAAAPAATSALLVGRALSLPPSGVLRRLRRLSARLVGLPRHLSQHPGGIVLTARPLAQVVPVEHARMENRLVIQWDKDSVELAGTTGLAKIDLLGLGMLGAIDACFDLIVQQTGTRLALHGASCDDPRVYDAICAGDTIGTFQIESRAQISFCLPQLQPRTYADLTVAVALVRPGPIQANATHPYLRRRQGLEPVRYPGGDAGRCLVEPILADTLGVCVFQDQVVELCRAAGLDAAEAAEVRRAMSSNRSPQRMAAVRDRLDVVLVARGLDAAGRAEILDMVQAFSGYGFVRGHAAAFAYLAYLSVWLKVYHPAALCAALLNMQPMGFYDAEVVVQDARRHGVRVLPPDLRHSRADCTLEAGAVRLGLRLIRGLGADACARLEAALHKEPFPRDLEELCMRTHLDEDEARALARAGALGCYIAERRQALWQAPLIARAALDRWLPALRTAVDPPVHLPQPTPAETFALDRAALGLALEGHALIHQRPALAQRRLHRASDLAAVPASRTVEVVGQTIVLQSPPTAKGVWFMALSDETGLINVVIPPHIYVRDRAAVRGEALVWIRGTVTRRGGVVALHALWVRSLSALLAGANT